MLSFCWRFDNYCLNGTMIQLPLNKITPHFQLLSMPKVDQPYLRIHEVPPLQ